MEEKIEEGNKLIGEFMGYKYYPEYKMNQIKGVLKKDGFMPIHLDISRKFHAKYHSSFDWLMPVVEKIESLNNGNSLLYYISIEGDRCEIRKNDFPPNDTLISLKCTHKNKLNSTFLALIEFIKWHNQTQITNNPSPLK